MWNPEEFRRRALTKQQRALNTSRDAMSHFIAALSARLLGDDATARSEEEQGTQLETEANRIQKTALADEVFTRHSPS